MTTSLILICNPIVSIMKSVHTCCLPVSHVKVKGAYMCAVSVPSCGQATTSRPFFLGGGSVAAQLLGLWCAPFPPSRPLPCHLIFTHISLPIQAAEGSWEIRRRRNHNSCRLATYSKMFTHWGVQSNRICLMAMLSMPSVWPKCLLALSWRSHVRFPFLLLLLFSWHGKKKTI